MAILPAPPPDWKRPAIPASLQVVLLKLLLRTLGVAKVNYDHRPPLSERQFDTETRDTIPPANDPAFLEAIAGGERGSEHDVRTNGPGGEKRITSAGSDANRRAKVRRLTPEQEEFRRKVLERPCGKKREPTGNWPRGRKIESRGFQRRRP